MLIETLFEYAVGISDSDNVISYAIDLGISVIIGFQGNYLYKLHIEKPVKVIIATNTPERNKIELARQGGTSIEAAIGYTVLLLAVLILVVVVAEQQA